MEIRTSSLRALREGASLDLDALASLAHLTPEQLARAEEGGRLDLPESLVKRLARLLGVEVKVVAVAREARGDADPVYDDAEPVMAKAPEPPRARAPAPEPEVDPVPPFERALLQAVAEGGFEEEDQQLVMGVLSLGTLPATVTAREMPAFARVWLDVARELRCVGVPEDQRAAPMLERVSATGPRSASRMAAGILEGLKRKAEARKPGKK